MIFRPCVESGMVFAHSYPPRYISLYKLYIFSGYNSRINQDIKFKFSAFLSLVEAIKCVKFQSDRCTCGTVSNKLSHVMTKPVLPYANKKGADQPAHPLSLISAFVVRFWVVYL